MFYVGFLAGSIFSILVWCSGFYLALIFIGKKEGQPILVPSPGGLFNIQGRKQKKTPKSPSEYDEWKREQKLPPKDPEVRRP